MNKKFAYLLIISLLLATINITPTYAQVEAVTISAPTEATADELEDILEIAIDTEEDVDDEEELTLDDISDDELLEAEPSDIPEDDEDEELTKRLTGRMLLDVEGNGEVYYIDPITGGKEYLADGKAAHALLERRALGINEETFAKLTVSTDKDAPSLCKTNKLANRLKGRILLRVEKNGEAYWVMPTNCQLYYAGTHDAAYALMKKFSLGLTKKNLAKIPNNKRQKFKKSLRYAIYNYAKEHDVTLKEAKEALKMKVKETHKCLKEKKEERLTDTDKKVKKRKRRRNRKQDAFKCIKEKQIKFPKLVKTKIRELKSLIKETRKENKDDKLSPRDIKIRHLLNRLEKVMDKKPDSDDNSDDDFHDNSDDNNDDSDDDDSDDDDSNSNSDY